VSGGHTEWLELVNPLRIRLKGKDRNGNRGSLRWFEKLMANRGGRPGAVRNILYKDLGSIEEKLRFYGILSELYAELQLEQPALPRGLVATRARQLLGRDKRAVYARFMRELNAGQVPQQIVVGGPSTGKTVLIEQVRLVLGEYHNIELTSDLTPALYSLVQAFGLGDEFGELITQLSPELPFALLASIQQELQELVAAGLNRAGVPLLLKAGREATLAGTPLRLRDGSKVDVTTWLEPLLAGLEVPYLAALSSAPTNLQYEMLRKPTLQEARRYLRLQLPHAGDERIEELVRKGGTDYRELSRVALLEASQLGNGNASQLLTDPHLTPVLRALAALSPATDPLVPVDLLESVLGRSLRDLNQAQKMLIEPGGNGRVRPAQRSLLEAMEQDPAVHEVALEYFKGNGNVLRQVYHARVAGRLPDLLDILEANPSRLGLLAGLWEESHDWPSQLRQRLARIVVAFEAMGGRRDSGEAQEAREYLRVVGDRQDLLWMRLKRAQELVSNGRFEDAARVIPDYREFDGAAKGEALLVTASIARRKGEGGRAQELVETALALGLPEPLRSRAQLQRGVLAKDAGRFREALYSFARVTHNSRLVSRAKFQAGDLQLYLGNVQEASYALQDSLGYYRSEADRKGEALVRARLASAWRRLGRYDEAEAEFERALENSQDRFTWEWVASEASLLEAARGRAWEAIRLAGRAEKYFRSEQQRSGEARYRRLRSLYRLAAGYGALESGRPFRPPYRYLATPGQARLILRALYDDVQPLAASGGRYAALFVDVAIGLSLVTDARSATAVLTPLRTVVQEPMRLEIGLAMAAALCRQGEVTEALEILAALRPLPSDPGMHAWRLAVEAECLLKSGHQAQAWSVIEEAGALPEMFREQLGRAWGQALIETGEVEGIPAGEMAQSPLALPDALAISFVSEGPNPARLFRR